MRAYQKRHDRKEAGNFKLQTEIFLVAFRVVRGIPGFRWVLPWWCVAYRVSVLNATEIYKCTVVIAAHHYRP